MAPLAAQDLPLVAEKSLCLGLQETETHGSGPESPGATMVSWRLLDLRRLSPTRWLALLERHESVVDPWEDLEQKRREARERITAVDAKFKRWQKTVHLALVQKDGKTIKTSAPVGGGSGEGPTASESQGLFADETWAACPYAVLLSGPSSPSLQCFDYELMPLRTVALPPGRVNGGVRSRQGEEDALRLFILDSSESGAPSGSKAQRFPRYLEAVLPVTGGSEIKPNVRRVAFPAGAFSRVVDEEARSLAVLPETVEVLPFSTLKAEGPIPIFCVARAGRPPAGEGDQRLVFFRSVLTETGFATFRQLPLWVIFESRGDAEVDEDRGVLRVPVGSRLHQVNAFPQSSKRMVLYVHLLINDQPPTPEGGGATKKTNEKQPESMGSLQLLVAFSEERLAHLLDLEELFFAPETFSAFGTADLRIVPAEVMGAADEHLMAVRTISMSRRTKTPVGPCAALYRLAP
ncbi:MAG: hypothetical protein ACP5NF_11390 [Thermoanaerobaculum sp.]